MVCLAECLAESIWHSAQERVGQTQKGDTQDRNANGSDKPQGIFGIPLNVSIKYANVAISLTNDNGESFIYGYVPIVVAKCGVFLKEKGALLSFSSSACWSPY